MMLNVGCGYRFTAGGVNIDMKPRAIADNLIIADALNLPIRENSMSKTICHHVIEHVANPTALIKELIRVTKGHIEIICPHRLTRTAKLASHRNYFGRKWFIETLKKLNVNFEVQIIISRTHSVLKIPFEVKADIWKGFD